MRTYTATGKTINYEVTEELRLLLDERGVEWTANDGEHVKETCWPYMDKLTAAFAEYDNGTTRFACDTWCFTPEQAIEATLGRGECEMVRSREYIETLQAENAKLRELVPDMWDGYNDPRCEECHLKDTPTCADCPICAREAAVIDRMRELGIEVA